MIQIDEMIKHLFHHIFAPVQNWGKSSLINKITELAARRKLDDLTIGPVLTVSLFYFIHAVGVFNRDFDNFI